MSKPTTKLALMIKCSGSPPQEKKSNDGFKGFFVGTVEVAPPEIQVRLSPEVVLYKENLVIAASVLKDYEREFEIFEGEEIIINGSRPNTFTAKGKIKWTDQIVEGNKVILVPAQNENMYILIEKAVEL